MKVVGHVVETDDTECRDSLIWWLDKLREGYIGSQNGNDGRIYFIAAHDGEKRIYARSIRDSDIFMQPLFEKHSISDIRGRLSSPRTFYIFKSETVKFTALRERIEELMSIHSCINSIMLNDQKFNEELL